MSGEELLQYAHAARGNAYAPYSRFAVGAALLCEDGRVFLGCNVENAAYPVTCCAERAALFAAVSAGARRFRAIAVSGAPLGQEPEAPCPPCGVCRQALREFCAPKEMRVYLDAPGGGMAETTLQALLPESFGPENLAP